MMYPRLKVAKDLLTEDGLILISIDDNELFNLKTICDEIFGAKNFIDAIVWDKKSSAKGVPPRNMMVNVHEYILAYQKGESFTFLGEKRDAENDGFKNPDNDPRGPWRESNIKSTSKAPEEAFTIVDPNTGKEYHNTWAFSKDTLERMIKENRILWKESLPKQKEFMYEMTNENKAIKSNWGCFDPQSTTMYLKHLLPQVKFDNPKPIKLMEYIMEVVVKNDDIVLDFFSGSGTTAHSVISNNLKNNINVKFIMVQIPEKCDIDSDAYKNGYKTICDIGETRIKLCGEEIKNGAGLLSEKLDVGFRVLKLDSSNMKDVYYNPKLTAQDGLFASVDNVKEDRTSLDLLFQVMLELGIELSAKINEKEIDGKQVYTVNDSYLVACFASEISENVIRECAKINPVYVVFRDNSFAKDSDNINCEQIIKTVSPSTELKVI